LLSTLMALQAGLPLLDFSSIAGAERKKLLAQCRPALTELRPDVRHICSDYFRNRQLQTKVDLSRGPVVLR